VSTTSYAAEKSTICRARIVSSSFDFLSSVKTRMSSRSLNAFCSLNPTTLPAGS
jgi:hypothetical protein